MAATLRQYLQLVRHFGPAWVSFRAYYAALQRAGLLQVRLPSRDWDQQPLRAFVQDATLADPHRYAAHRSTASRARKSMEGMTVLDLGANAGGLSVEFARRGAQVTAVEIDDRPVDIERPFCLRR